MSRVNHCCVRIDGVSQFLRCLHKNQLGSREPNGIVKSTPAAHHDDFILQSRSVGKLPDIFWIATSHACRSSGCHRASRPGSDHAGFGASQFSETPAGGMLQFEHVDEVFCSLSLCRLHFGKFQRAAQVCPGAPAINDGLYAEARVDVLARVFAERSGGTGERVFSSNLAQQRRCCG